MPRSATLATACALAVLTGLFLPVRATAGTPDTTAPATNVNPMGDTSEGPVTLAARTRFEVETYDDSEIASYDVRISRTPMRSTKREAWTYPADLQGVTAVPRIRIRKGEVLCIGVRALDTAGNQESWAAGANNDNRACAVRPVDDSSHLFRRSGRIDVVRSPKYWNGSARILHRGSRMVMRGIPRHSRVSVLATGLPDHDRGLMWDYPGVTACFAWNTDRVRHRQLTTYENRFSKRGALRILEYNDRTFPFDGVAVLPRWLI